MRLPFLFSAACSVLVMAAACQPEVVIARSEPETAGNGGMPAAAAGTSSGATTPTAGSTSPSAGTRGEPPVGGEGGGPTPIPDPPRILADSVVDFSFTQGERSWTYGYDTGSLDTFKEFTMKSIITNYNPPSHDAWECWVSTTAHWTQMFQLGAHPNGTVTSTADNDRLERAVRRWTSNFAGEVTISGEIAKIDVETTGGGNGVEAFIYVDNKPIPTYRTTIAANDGGGRAYKVKETLNVGSTVDFVLDPLEGDDRHDLTRFTGIIVRVETGPGTSQ